MKKRDELSNPASCMSRAHDDELTFVLLARDAAAPTAVRAWVVERIRLGKNTRADAQIRDAEEWVTAVEALQGETSQPRPGREEANATRGLYAALTAIANGDYDNAHDPKAAARIARVALAKADATLTKEPS